MEIISNKNDELIKQEDIFLIKVKNREKQQVYKWDVKKFENRLFVMRDLFD